MSKFVEANEKIAETVVEGYKKIENGVVTGYKKIETGVVEGFRQMCGKAFHQGRWNRRRCQEETFRQWHIKKLTKTY